MSFSKSFPPVLYCPYAITRRCILDFSVRLVSLPEPEDSEERRGICLPFPFMYLFCLSWFPQMSSSPPFSSQAKLSAAATLDLPAPNWQPDLLFLPLGICTKPYLYHGGKAQLRGDMNTEHPLYRCPGRGRGKGSCHCDTHAKILVYSQEFTRCRMTPG